MYIFAFMRLAPWQRVAFLAGLLVSILVCTTGLHAVTRDRVQWTPKERALIRSLSLTSRQPLPRDPSNRFGDDSAAARLGQLLFFDTRLSSTGMVSCASCHVADRDFQDGRARGHGVGDGSRRTMPIAGTARSPWFFWDGRADSQWEQALGPLENPVEHGGDRTQYALLLGSRYRVMYEAVFGRMPKLEGLPAHAGPVANIESARAWNRLSDQRRDDFSRVYANIGKAIAAYERRIEFGPSRFDDYAMHVESPSASAPAIFTSDEEAGLRLFIGKGNCVNCHNGTELTDNHFHNTGVSLSATEREPDSGRTTGVRRARDAEFSCTSRYSDAKSDECAELRFAVIEGPELMRAFKAPSLRNVVRRAPYVHAGQLATLDQVLEHYSNAPRAPYGVSELKPLKLSLGERKQLIAFLGTLSGPISAPPGYLIAPNFTYGSTND